MDQISTVKETCYLLTLSFCSFICQLLYNTLVQYPGVHILLDFVETGTLCSLS